MKQSYSPLFFLLLLFVSTPLLLPAQGRVGIVSQVDSLTVLRLHDLDVLTRLAGDPDTTHPYYTFLWIFGDGTFINGTRDSIIGHVYEERDNRLFRATTGADVIVYATGNYSGGARPPRMAPSPNDFYRSPSVIRSTLKKDLLQGHVDPTPAPIDTSVIDTTRTGLLRLQLSKKVRPQDTLVAIVSFRQPQEKPPLPVSGQLFLFYNSRVKSAEAVPSSIEGEFRNVPPPAAPSLTHGKLDYQRSLVQFRHMADLGKGNTMPYGISAYSDFLVWSYDSLKSRGADERHLFAEFGVDSVMWELFKDGRSDTLSFLAVMTAYGFNADQIALLPSASGPVVDTTGIAALLNERYYVGNNEFASFENADLNGKIVAISEVKTPVVSSHDPNELKLFACQCPDTTRRKVLGSLTFSNDGHAATSLLKVTLHVPEQLNLNSIETIRLDPAPPTALEPVVDLTNRTITWAWAAMLQPAESAGFGHPSTIGRIDFSLDLKPGFDVPDLDSTWACIVFDANTPMCTRPVAASEVIFSYQNGDVQQYLACKACPEHQPEGESPWWWCIKWGLLLLLLLLLIWILRKIVR